MARDFPYRRPTFRQSSGAEPGSHPARSGQRRSMTWRRVSPSSDGQLGRPGTRIISLVLDAGLGGCDTLALSPHRNLRAGCPDGAVIFGVVGVRIDTRLNVTSRALVLTPFSSQNSIRTPSSTVQFRELFVRRTRPGMGLSSQWRFPSECALCGSSPKAPPFSIQVLLEILRLRERENVHCSRSAARERRRLPPTSVSLFHSLGNHHARFRDCTYFSTRAGTRNRKNTTRSVAWANDVVLAALQRRYKRAMASLAGPFIVHGRRPSSERASVVAAHTAPQNASSPRFLADGGRMNQSKPRGLGGSPASSR
jgi:hypothetical protein